MTRSVSISLIAVTVVVFFVPALILLDYFGLIWHNNIFAFFFPIKGLDVSHHQGEIDWAKVAATGQYSFAYIKATEGHDFTDDSFAANWQGAQQIGLKVGAYHFFSVRSSGAEQAKYFIAYVPRDSATLPPVIDVEIDVNQDKEAVRAELTALMDALEVHYQQQPVLYATYETYNAYLRDHFADHQLWIRDVFWFPRMPDREWRFWQYNNRGRVPGIEGFVDINVFRGSVEELGNKDL